VDKLLVYNSCSKIPVIGFYQFLINPIGCWVTGEDKPSRACDRHSFICPFVRSIATQTAKKIEEVFISNTGVFNLVNNNPIIGSRKEVRGCLTINRCLTPLLNIGKLTILPFFK